MRPTALVTGGAGGVGRAIARAPLGREGRPADGAGLVRFLCRDEAAFITGALVPVDGGRLLGEAVT